jgi:hypothetical protein
VTDRERFVAVVRGEPCDYVPIFGFHGAPGVSAGCMRKTCDRLRATGMPDVGGCWDLGGEPVNLEGWYRYWGTTGPIDPGFFPAEPARGIASERRIKVTRLQAVDELALGIVEDKDRRDRLPCLVDEIVRVDLRLSTDHRDQFCCDVDRTNPLQALASVRMQGMIEGPREGHDELLERPCGPERCAQLRKADHVEQIAWLAPIEHGADLPGGDLRETAQLHLRSIQIPGLPHRSRPKRSQREALRVVQVDFDSISRSGRIGVVEEELSTGVLVPGPLNRVLQLAGDRLDGSFHVGALPKHGFPVQGTDIVEVQIHGQP